jgi:hypothetical protein
MFEAEELRAWCSNNSHKNQHRLSRRKLIFVGSIMRPIDAKQPSALNYLSA